jgi:hypothetical protein
LSPAPVLEVISRFVNPKKIGSPVSMPAIPSLEEMLAQVGRLPKECLFFGYAEDDLPVLLNLRNSAPGPILISGDAGAGKTNLLKVITQFATLRYDADEIQFGVITDRPEEWKDRVEFPHCVGIFSMCEEDTANFIRALEAWTKLRRRHNESVLLLIDNLDAFAHWNGGLIQEMHNLLLHGPEKQIWTIATFNPKQHGCADVWLKYFHTQVFGYTNSLAIPGDTGMPETRINALSKGLEFFLKESTKWIKFRIPKV